GSVLWEGAAKAIRRRRRCHGGMGAGRRGSGTLAPFRPEAATVLLNCDLGEWSGAVDDSPDAAVMPHIDLANIACGLHAGGPLTMRRTLALARDHGVAIGAHPGYADPANQGRVSVPHSAEALIA